MEWERTTGKKNIVPHVQMHIIQCNIIRPAKREETEAVVPLQLFIYFHSTAAQCSLEVVSGQKLEEKTKQIKPLRTENYDLETVPITHKACASFHLVMYCDREYMYTGKGKNKKSK